ncbi:MAG: alpha-L-fucosidase [Planctomycetota bacterium]|jgi:alpha-L-fucosidase
MNINLPRRSFLKVAGIGLASMFSPRHIKKGIPPYLTDYRDLYLISPQKAALEWFKHAKFGLFINYGLYSLLGRGEWVQYHEKIPVAQYAKLINNFTAQNFNADSICDLALEAEMKYINFDTAHHDGFCLFRTKQTNFNSLQSPAKRDFVEELAKACAKRKLGLCLYYSHGRNWRHPHAPNNDKWAGNARPGYDLPEPSYAYGQEHDLNKYIDYVNAQITELLTQYGPIANIWFDGYGVPVNGPTEKFRIPPDISAYTQTSAANPHLL